MTILFTIGHSNLSFPEFLALLRRHGIRHLVDVRSQPFSRRFPHFSKEALEHALGEHGIEYRFAGDALGGRPAGAAYRRPDGSVNYARRARDADFLAAVAQLCDAAAEGPTAMMCAEEDPARCHRQALVTPAALAQGVTVVHIRRDGRLEQPTGDGTDQLGLFD